VQEDLQYFQNIILGRRFKAVDKAASVAKRRAAGMRVINVTLARLAKRANAAIRLSGIRAAAGRVMPSSRTDLSRSIAARKAGPLTRVGPERSLSSQEPRLPSGTVSKYSSRLRCSPVMPRPNKRHTLASTLLRRRTTNRSSVQPGKRILCANNQAVARSKSLLGRSVPVQHKPYSQRVRRKPTRGSVISLYP
jgi:hypothetical protein